jgi:hypothetical protein
MDLVIGRHLEHTAEYHDRFPDRLPAARRRLAETIAALDAWNAGPGQDPARAAATTMLGAPEALPGGGPAWDAAWHRLADLIVRGERHDAEVYRALGALADRAGQADLAYYAYQRALEAGHPAHAALAARTAELEATWKAAGRADPPSAESYRFMRSGGDRWRASYQRSEREAVKATEDPDAPDVLGRMVLQADVEVPETVLAADSFLRRWGVGLLVAGVGGAFWVLYLVAVLRKRRRPA